MAVPAPYDPESIRLASAALADRRGEINERSRAQHTIIQIAFTAVGAVLGVALGTNADRVLLLLPLISPPLGVLYVDHGVNIARIGEFMRTDIVPILAPVPGARQVLGYELAVSRFERQRTLRLLLFGGPLLLIFAGAPIGALVHLYRAGYLDSGAMKVIWGGGVVLVAWYLLVWWTFVFLRVGRSDPGATARPQQAPTK